MADLFSPPLSVQSVTVTDELTIPAQTLHSTASQPHSEDIYAETWNALSRIAKHRQNIMEQTQLIEQESLALFSRLDETKGKLSGQDALISRHVTAEAHIHRHAELDALADLVQQGREENQRPPTSPEEENNTRGMEHA